MDKNSIVERVKKIADGVSAAAGIELVNVDISGTKRDVVLRIFIDKTGGVNLEDCSRVSRDIEAVLDEEDFVPGRYVLEVSSPGIERQLYSLADFVKFIGYLAKLKTREEIGGQKIFVGTISEVNDEEITFADNTKGPLTIPYALVEKANLKIDLSREFGRK